MHGGYGITFHSAGSCWFSYDTVRIVIHFGIDNNLSFHSDNRKNKCLVLGEGPTFGINGSLGSSDRKLSFIFSKPNTKCWVFTIILTIVICFLMEKIFKFKANNKNVNCPTQFCLGSASNGFSATESREVSLMDICMIL